MGRKGSDTSTVRARISTRAAVVGLLSLHFSFVFSWPPFSLFTHIHDDDVVVVVDKERPTIIGRSASMPTSRATITDSLAMMSTPFQLVKHIQSTPSSTENIVPSLVADSIGRNIRLAGFFDDR